MEVISNFYIYPLAALLILFIFYVVLMELLAIYGEDNLLLKPFVFIFVIMDWIVNWMLTPIFLDLPGEAFELVTGRMKRYKKKYATFDKVKTNLDQWRYDFAYWLCKHLNRHDRGHC